MEVEPLGVLRTCWPDRWGVPRQPGLVPEAWGVLELADHVPIEAVRGLTDFSHLWLIAFLHGVTDTRWTVRPPRLTGSRVGVLATRSPHRPSRMALSVVKLEAVDEPGRRIRISGHDLLDGTPILDVRPYLPYVDAIPDARADWAARAPDPLPVTWTAAARAAAPDHLVPLIEGTLAADPRQGSRPWPRISVRVEHLDVHAHDESGVWVIDEVRVWSGGV